MKTIEISVVLSTVLLAEMDHSEDAAVEAVEKKIRETYPDAEISVSSSRGAMVRHSIEVYTEDGFLGAGDRGVDDVRDAMLSALDSLIP